MAESPRPSESSERPLERLIREGLVRAPDRRLSDVLAERGALGGPITDAGSRAVQEQRGERG